SHLHRPAFDTHRGLAHRFGQGGMGVAGAGDVLRRRPELDGECCFCDQVSGFGAQYVHAQYAIRLRIGQHFREAVRCRDGLGARIGGEGEFADLVGYSGGFQFLFGFADTCHFRRGVDDGGNGVVVHMPRAARDVLDTGNAFVFGLVRQHRAFARVADGPDSRHVGLEMRVRRHATACVEFHPGVCDTELVGIGTAADADEHDVRFDSLRHAASGRFDRHAQHVAFLLDTHDLGRELEFQALLLQDALELLADLAVEAGRDAVEEFNHQHLGAQPAPYRSQFETDITTADHQQTLRHFLQFERAGGRNDTVFIDGDARQRHHVGTGGDDDVLRLQRADLTVLRLHIDAAGTCY